MNYYDMTTPELLKLTEEIQNEPANRMPPGNVQLYAKAARAKLDKIAWAITQNIAEKRASEGRPVPTCGYSGRNCNRRR